MPVCVPSTVPPVTSSHVLPMSSDDDDAIARHRLLARVVLLRMDRAKLRLLSLAETEAAAGFSVSSTDRLLVFALMTPPICVLLALGFRIARIFLRLVDNVFGLGSFSARYRVRDVDLTGSFFLANFIFMLMMSCPERGATRGGLRLRSVSVLAPTYVFSLRSSVTFALERAYRGIRVGELVFGRKRDIVS